MITMHFLRLK